MRYVFLASLLYLLPLMGCPSSSSSSGLQSSCVADQLDLVPYLDDGDTCYNFSYSDCDSGDSASECVNSCAFDVCQNAECDSDSDCTAFGTGSTCESYIVSGDDYGQWCRPGDDGGGFLDPCSGCGGVFCSGDCIGCPQC